MKKRKKEKEREEKEKRKGKISKTISKILTVTSPFAKSCTATATAQMCVFKFFLDQVNVDIAYNVSSYALN
jgi:hypothetical protein